MNKYNDTLNVINHMAMVKMAMNQHKGNIEDVYIGDLVKMLDDETRELVEAIDKDDTLRVIEEAADCMNFLVANVHQRIDKYRGRNHD